MERVTVSPGTRARSFARVSALSLALRVSTALPSGMAMLPVDSSTCSTTYWVCLPMRGSVE